MKSCLPITLCLVFVIIGVYRYSKPIVIEMAKNMINYWPDKYKNLCDGITPDLLWTKPQSRCFTYMHNFRETKCEVVNWSPVILIYRDMLSEKQVQDFAEIIKSNNLTQQQVKSEDGGSEVHRARVANGTWIEPYHNNASISVYETAIQTIPAINFTSIESFSGLSYLPGGHYSPHYDYLDFKNASMEDEITKLFRNRMATLIFVLKTATEGGGTVFPAIKTTVRANSGDAFIWFNERADETLEVKSYHGGCPVYKGEKIIATIWIRSAGQSILPMADANEPITAEWLIPGYSEKIRSQIPNQCSIKA